MAQSTGKTGRGVKFEMREIESPEGAWVAVANVSSIGFSGRNAEEIDFTHLDSTGGFREFRQGFKDPGTVNLEVHFDPTNSTHQQLLTLFLSGDLFEFRVNYLGAGWNQAEVGLGFVQNPSDTNINPNDPIGGTATIRVSGGTAFETVSP